MQNIHLTIIRFCFTLRRRKNRFPRAGKGSGKCIPYKNRLSCVRSVYVMRRRSAEGMGICGRPLCCHTYLSEFAPVSIKMAKEQNLSLNPTKISGVCGRLMCCLTNEEETYEELNSHLPANGDHVKTPEGLRGKYSLLTYSVSW